MISSIPYLPPHVPLREGEVDGDIYHFLSTEAFKKGIDEGKFLEWAVVHQDNYYGLIKEPILEGLRRKEKQL